MLFLLFDYLFSCRHCRFRDSSVFGDEKCNMIHQEGKGRESSRKPRIYSKKKQNRISMRVGWFVVKKSNSFVVNSKRRTPRRLLLMVVVLLPMQQRPPRDGHRDPVPPPALPSLVHQVPPPAFVRLLVLRSPVAAATATAGQCTLRFFVGNSLVFVVIVVA